MPYIWKCWGLEICPAYFQKQLVYIRFDRINKVFWRLTHFGHDPKEKFMLSSFNYPPHHH